MSNDEEELKWKSTSLKTIWFNFVIWNMDIKDSGDILWREWILLG